MKMLLRFRSQLRETGSPEQLGPRGVPAAALRRRPVLPRVLRTSLQPLCILYGRYTDNWNLHAAHSVAYVPIVPQP